MGAVVFAVVVVVVVSVDVVDVVDDDGCGEARGEGLSCGGGV